MKEEGRRKKEEGRRKKEEGRRKKEEGKITLPLCRVLMGALYRLVNSQQLLVSSY